jgi:hypothetical protein
MTLGYSMEHIYFFVGDHKKAFKKRGSAIYSLIPEEVRKSTNRPNDIFDSEGNIRSGKYRIDFFKLNNKSFKLKAERLD